MWVPVAVWQPCELLYTCYPVSLPGWASPGKWLSHWNSSDITSKNELIFIFPLLQPPFEAVQGITRYCVFIHVVPPCNYLFTEKNAVKSVLNLTFFNFQLCPWVRDDLSKVKNLLKSADDKPHDILYTSIKSPLFLLSSKDHNFKVFECLLCCIPSFSNPGSFS